MNYRITDYLDKTVKEFPNKVAFVDNNREIAFGELRDEAFLIADRLISVGCFKQPVLIFMEKSVPMISSFVGVAYSGNFYSPIDTKMPIDRIEKIIETLKPKVVITDAKHKEIVESFCSDSIIMIYEEIITPRKIDVDSITKITDRIIDTDVLYVLFTSGSTGLPKGVIICHRAAIDFVDWISDCYNFSSTTVFANQAQLYFDLSIQDVYAPLKNGSTTVLIPNRVYSSPIRVWKIILEKKVNTLVWIPSMLSLFANLDVLSHVDKAPLTTVLFCGEVMPMKQLNYWIRNYPNVVYGNLYGPTECTEACTYYTINRPFKDEEMLPMGKACENSEVMVLGDNGELITSVGKIGELCVRGTCLSHGYYGDRSRTEEVFIQNPLNDKYKELIYKTGDLVYYNEFEELVYVSRKDFQIKIRGYRVELGEIEAAVSAIKEITYSCCLFDSSHEKIVLVYTGEIAPEKINEILKTKLQDYMIPSEYKQREKMIFNINGKIDRKSLAKEYGI